MRLVSGVLSSWATMLRNASMRAFAIRNALSWVRAASRSRRSCSCSRNTTAGRSVASSSRAIPTASGALRPAGLGDVSSAWTMITTPATTTATLGATNWMLASTSCQVRRAAGSRRARAQLNWSEAQPDQTGQWDEHIADEPEQVGCAARTVGVRRVEQQQGGPRVRDEERDDRQAQQGDDQLVPGRATGAGQGHHEPIEEHEVDRLDSSILMSLLSGGSRVWSESGSSTKYQERAVTALIHSTPSTMTRTPGSQRPPAVEKEQGGDEAGILQDEEEIGQAREGHAMWIDDHIGNRPGGAGDRVGEHAQR